MHRVEIFKSILRFWKYQHLILAQKLQQHSESQKRNRKHYIIIFNYLILVKFKTRLILQYHDTFLIVCSFNI